MVHAPNRSTVRDWGFIVVGLGGIVFEATIYAGQPRWPLLACYLTLLGLPSALHLDALAARFSKPPAPPDEPPGK